MQLERRWLTSFVDRCQRLTGNPPPDPAATVRELRALVAEAPATISLPERFLVRGLFAEVAARLEGATPDGCRRVSRALLSVAPTTPYDSFRDELSRLIDRCVEAIRSHDRTAPPTDPRVHHVLSFIQARHRERALTLRTAAADAQLSPWHLDRLLRQQTGYSFLAHVHRARVLSARRLIETTSLGIDEIAAAVGYASARQLDRHFKHIHGTTSVLFRHRVDHERGAHDPIADSSH
jgi:AraC-like DNA-binding protein